MKLRETILDSFLRATSNPALSRFVGRMSDAQLPRPVLLQLLRLYVKAFRVDLEDAARPLEDFTSFDDFFTRRLRPGARTIAPGAETLVSPVDGALANAGDVQEGRILQVKGIDYSVAELLDDEVAARRFIGGSFLTFYLSPRDYHRIHAPVDGEILGYRYVPGRLYPVNSLGTRHVPALFAQNERLTTYLRTPHGQMAVVKVGATSVGRISVVYDEVRTNSGLEQAQALHYARPIQTRKGEELGVFHLGSTVVLLTENPVRALSWNDDELPRPIFVGERVGTLPLV